MEICLDMNKYQNEQYGSRARPEFEEALCFFIQLDTDFLEIEDCSHVVKRVDSSKSKLVIEIEVTVSKPVAEKWSGLT